MYTIYLSLLFLIGGAWVLGSKETGIISSIIKKAQAGGFLVVSINYQLCDGLGVRFPEFLIDCKRALRFIRSTVTEKMMNSNLDKINNNSLFSEFEDVEREGLSSIYKRLNPNDAKPLDISTIVASGDSAGGHLCQLLSLTSNDVHYQPGFETVDTSLIGVIDMFGPSEFHKTRKFAEEIVLGNKDGYLLNEGGSKSLFQPLSPITYFIQFEEEERSFSSGNSSCKNKVRLIPKLPKLPEYWLCFHGTCDGLVPIEEGRNFYNHFFRHLSQNNKINFYPTLENGYNKFLAKDSCKAIKKSIRIEAKGSQHGFLGVDCWRSEVCMLGVAVFLRQIVSERGLVEDLDLMLGSDDDVAEDGGVTVESVSIKVD